MRLWLNRVVRSNLLKQGAIYIFADALNKSIPFLILPILTNYLIPKEFSIVSNYTVFVTIVGIFLALGTQTYINTIFYKFDKSEISRYIGNALYLLMITTVMILAISFIARSLLLGFISVPFNYILLAVLTASFTVISTIRTSIWRLENKATYFGSFQITQTGLSFILSLVLIISFGLNWKGRIIGLVVSSILYGLFSIYLLWRDGYIYLNLNKKKIVDLLKFGLPIVPHSLALWVRSGVDRVIVTSVCGHDINGQFVAGSQFGLAVSFFVLSFHNAYVPFLYQKLSEKNQDALESNKRVIVKFTYIYLLGIFFFCCLTTFLSIWFINNHMNRRYHESIKYVPWAMIQQFILAIYLMSVSYLFYIKKTAKVALATFACAIMQILLSFFLVKKVGAIGASITGVLVIFINSIWIIMLTNKYYPMPWLKIHKK